MDSLRTTPGFRTWLLGLFCLLCAATVHSQIALDTLNCNPNANFEINSHHVNFNYGATTNAFAFTNRSNLIVGQPLTGKSLDRKNITEYGFYANFFLPPLPPAVVATQGDYPDRIQIEWSANPLGSEATDGFVILRDDAYLDQVDNQTRQYIDFNVQAGEFYEYRVVGRNAFGNGTPGKDVGFVNPNGLVLGQITTLSRNPVAGTVVALTPSQGKALSFDGKDDFICVPYDTLNMPTDMWTASFWVKFDSLEVDNTPIVDLGSDFDHNFWFTTHINGAEKGISVAVGDGDGHEELTAVFTDDADGWHQVAAVYGGGRVLLYVDGVFRGGKLAPIKVSRRRFFIGTNMDQSAYFNGKLDEIRLYNAPLTQTTILQTKDITVSSLAPNIVMYWKADEGLGRKVFDITQNNIDGELNGPVFTDDAASVLNAGTSDAEGRYVIEGINYSQTQTFTATPSKSFYSSQSLEFNAAYDSYAELDSFDLADTATIEIAVRPFDLESRQTILQQGTGFEFYIEEGSYKLQLNGGVSVLGPVVDEYSYLQIQLDGSTNQILFHRNGNLINTVGGSVSGDFSGSNWYVAARNGNADFYTGLVDMVAVFDTVYATPQLQLHASPLAGENLTTGIDIGDPHLTVFYGFDEGRGTEVDEYGPFKLEAGTIHGAAFSVIAYRQLETPHLFRPSSRIVNLNNSATTVNNINFTDESTVTISGVVRFDGTSCVQDSVEILVNGFSFFPKIYTDSTGRFVGDFEPGANVTLTPKFSDTTHFFRPGFFEARRLNRPIAQVGFINTTKRTVRGQLAGGDCKASIYDENNPPRVKVATLNGCFEREITIDNEAGTYVIPNLPPEQFTVAVTYHPNPNIREAFNLAGAETIDLREAEADTVDFIYFAPPQVRLQPFESLANCPGVPAFIAQSDNGNGYQEYELDVVVYEKYGDDSCVLENYDLIINNNVWGIPVDTVAVRDTNIYTIKTLASEPNLTGDRTRFIQVTARTPFGSATDVERVIVTGKRSRESTFTTASPAYPMIVLRDPPGDGSFATYEEGSSTCTTLEKATLKNLETGSDFNVDLGAKTQVVAAPLGAGKIIESEVVANSSVVGYYNELDEGVKGTELCVSTTKSYSTSDDDAVVGPDADLFVGAAVNWAFSTTDILLFDYETCQFKDSLGYNMDIDDFGTTYIYSAWQIKTDVIPSLEAQGRSGDAAAWRNLLKYNDDDKRTAKLVKNLSIDALNVYTESTTNSSDSSVTYTAQVEYGGGLETAAGGEILGIGTQLQLTISEGGGSSTTNDTTVSNEVTVSYTLADDDPNDNWSINILKSETFGTPIFQVVAGETMCPWEPGTLNREQVGFGINQLQEVNVPANDPAIFNLQLSNDSQTGNDPLIYILGMVEGSNPDGAIVSVDGEGLVEPRPFQILPGETIELLVTVERGPEEYSYSDIGLFMASECQWEHARGLGYDLSDHAPLTDDGDPNVQGIYYAPDLDKFYQEYRIGVDFLEPCSPINISDPLDDWVVTPDQNNQLAINLVEYDWDDPNLDVFRVQYRRTGGDGAWINIEEIPASDLSINDEVYRLVTWNMADLEDGPYEIRAVAECTDRSLNPGISRTIKGRKETRPPTMFGNPEPADGVLSPGDEVSITFTKRIDCTEILQADGIGTNINFNNLALMDVATGTLVDATIACSGDKIVITPNVANRFIENRTLRVVTNDIKDLYGNGTPEIVWEFYVNRSNLYWDGGGLDETVEEGNRLTVTREIRNQGGAATSWTIDEVPSWMTVFPREGSLEPGTRQIVTIEFPASLPSDAYEHTLIMTTVDGPEPLDVDLRVTCPAPPWAFDAAQYDFTMSMTVELNVEGELSFDRVDQVAAFVGDELRGLANIEYVEVLDQNGINAYLAFLTIYSNVTAGEMVDFQIWDASGCRLYGATVERFPFVPDNVIGAPITPQTLHTTGEVLRKIYLSPGWNWISYNVDLADNSTNAFLSSLTNAGDNMVIKGQTAFSQFLPGPDVWLGSLNSLDNTTMYQLRSNTVDSISLVGVAADDETPLPVVAGWNWIGHLPSRSLTVDDALQNLTLTNRALVKGQFAFAQYLPGVGWIGNLNFLSSPNGYLLFLEDAGDIVYPEDKRSPDGSAGKPDYFVQSHFDTTGLRWVVNPQDYEYTMNMVATVHDSLGINVLAPGDQIGVFHGDEVRGVATVQYVPELDVHLAFVTAYANVDGEPLTFKFFDRKKDKELPIMDEFNFTINQVLGRADQPQPLRLFGGTTNTTVTPSLSKHFLEVYPNPTGRGQSVYFKFGADRGEQLQIRITDALGRVIEALPYEAVAEENLLEWKPRELAAGMYYVTLQSETTLRTVRLQVR